MLTLKVQQVRCSCRWVNSKARFSAYPDAPCMESLPTTYHKIDPNLGLNTPIPWIRHGIYFKPSTLSIDNTVDGRNPAPVDMVNIPLFSRFYTSKRWLFGISSSNSTIDEMTTSFLNMTS